MSLDKLNTTQEKLTAIWRMNSFDTKWLNVLINLWQKINWDQSFDFVKYEKQICKFTIEKRDFYALINIIISLMVFILEYYIISNSCYLI